MAEELEPHILERFNIIQRLGKGAYGVVWKAIDKKSKKVCALKKVFDAFHNSTDAQRTFREVMFLKELRRHENIVYLVDLMEAKNPNDIYLIFEFMETDQHAVIRGKLLENVHKQYVIYQILKGMKYIHSAEIIHRDLKPSNVLLNSDCLAKVADFGLARSFGKDDTEGDVVFTEYIATRWYRAPEIVLGSQKYTKAIDMWSVGCILAEMITGKATFPGKSTLNQIELILELQGRPSNEDLESLDSNLAVNLLNNIKANKKRSFKQLFGHAPPEALDFLRKLLTFNPKKRITVEEALEHPYVADFHNLEEEISINRPVKIPISDNTRLSRHQYRDALHMFIERGRQRAVRKSHASKERQSAQASKERQSAQVQQTNNTNTQHAQNKNHRENHERSFHKTEADNKREQNHKKTSSHQFESTSTSNQEYIQHMKAEKYMKQQNHSVDHSTKNSNNQYNYGHQIVKSTMNNNAVLKERTMSQDNTYLSNKQQEINNSRSFYDKQNRVNTEQPTKEYISQKNIDNTSNLTQKQMIDLIQQQKQSTSTNNKENYYFRYLKQMTQNNFLNTEPAPPTNTVSTNSINHNVLGATTTSNKNEKPAHHKTRERPSVNSNYHHHQIKESSCDMSGIYKENKLEKSDKFEKSDKYEKRPSNNRIGSKGRISSSKNNYLGESHADQSSNMMDKQMRDPNINEKGRKRTDTASTSHNAKFLYNVIMNGSKDKKPRRDMYNNKKTKI